MPKHSHNPKPIVTTPRVSKKERKSVISDFHVLLKQKDAVGRDDKIDPATKQAQLEQIEEKMNQVCFLFILFIFKSYSISHYHF